MVPGPDDQAAVLDLGNGCWLASNRGLWANCIIVSKVQMVTTAGAPRAHAEFLHGATLSGYLTFGITLMRFRYGRTRAGDRAFRGSYLPAGPSAWMTID